MTNNSVSIADGNILLYRLPHTPYWQARLKTARGWISRSTKCKEQFEAGLRAMKMLDQPIRASKKHRRKTPSSFETYADLYIDSLNRNPKAIHSTYKSILSNWILPYFGKLDVDGINEDTISAYWEWCNQRKQLAKDTVDHHHSILRNILNFAIKEGVYSKDNLPSDWQQFNNGYDGIPRPSFSLNDYRKVHRALRYYHLKEPPSHKAAYLRQLMREYVLILANTCIRPGKEMGALKWKNIDLHWTHPVSKKKYVRIHVTEGKRGSRPIIARHSCRKFLERLGELTGRTDPDDFLFCMPNGKPVRPFYDAFRRFLIKHNLRYDLSGQERTLYSLRHFAISCQILYKKVPLLVIAKQAGTSVAIIEKHYAKVSVEAFADELAS